MNTRYLADPLQQLTHAYKGYLHRAIRAADIPLPGTHVRVLKIIASQAPATAQGLALRLRRDKAQITRALADVVEVGLVLRRENPQDRRSQWLELTPAGEALLARVALIEKEAARRMTQGLSADEVQTFIRLAQHMAENLNESD
jgi:DNA-binding MarR family transcriptional regulator